MKYMSSGDHFSVETPALTVDEAIGQRELLHGQVIRVQGLLNIQFENQTLSPPELTDPIDQPERRIWVSFPTLRKVKQEEFRQEYDRMIVDLVGTLHADRHGHLDMFAAEIVSTEPTILAKGPRRKRKAGQLPRAVSFLSSPSRVEYCWE